MSSYTTSYFIYLFINKQTGPMASNAVQNQYKINRYFKLYYKIEQIKSQIFKKIKNSNKHNNIVANKCWTKSATLIPCVSYSKLFGRCWICEPCNDKPSINPFVDSGKVDTYTRVW